MKIKARQESCLKGFFFSFINYQCIHLIANCERSLGKIK